ncbi:MAG: hypothetical protein IAF94_10620 [Pirellulaceae bacterium]|nr:hypothetical protein [Pirellulaceae bacterium]
MRTLIHRLGRCITVKERANGPGTTFEVQLPGKALDSTTDSDKQEAA